MPESCSDGHNLRNKLKNAQTVKPGVGCPNGLKDIFVEIAIIVEQPQNVENELKVHFLSVHLLVYPSYQDRENIVEEFRASFFEHFFGNGSELGLIVKAVDLIHDFLCHFVDSLGMVLLAHGRLGDRV